MNNYPLRRSNFLISQLANELQLVKNANPEFFQTRTAYEEDPGMKYQFRVEEQLAKNVARRDPDQDAELFTNWSLTMKPTLKRLPIDNVQKRIVQTVKDSKYTVIVGGTGSGKSTRVPQMILRDKIMSMEGSSCSIICTQPRRVAATSIAKRVAYELGEKIGKSVGYAIRGDVVHCEQKTANITFCTTGVLLRKLQDNPGLIGTSHVIVDEIHERSLDLEMLIHFLKELATYRRDFKLIVMSATMDQVTFRKYFDNCQVLEIPGSLFPVDTYYLDDMPQLIGTPVSAVEIDSDNRYFVVLKLVEMIVNSGKTGAILIFVPGWKDMAMVNKRLHEFNRRQTNANNKLKIRLLHSRVSIEDHKIFDAIKGPGRKVLISTTIAESSITVPDVVFVIDLGRITVSSFYDDHESSAFSEDFVTRASAEQRKGRAGRVQPGICYRLYTRQQFACLAEYSDPEKGNQNVTSVILNILSLGEDVDLFGYFVNKPKKSHLKYELQKLRHYNMIGPNSKLTLLGRRVNEMSADPLVAKMMLLGSIFGCGAQVAVVAAGLANSRLFPKPEGHPVTRRAFKIDPNHNVPSRVDLTRQLTLSKTSDGLSIIGAVRKYMEASNKVQFCDRYLMDQRSLEEVMLLRETVEREMALFKGAAPRQMSTVCLENIMAAAFLPNLSWTQ